MTAVSLKSERGTKINGTGRKVAAANYKTSINYSLFLAGRKGNRLKRDEFILCEPSGKYVGSNSTKNPAGPGTDDRETIVINSG